MTWTAATPEIFNFSPSLLCLIALLIAVCSGSAPNEAPNPRELITSPDGWQSGAFETAFDSSNLHEYVNGGAERYLGYGFRRLYVREFTDDTKSHTLRAEIYQMDSPANAYGIFSSDRAGENPGDIGSDAALGDYLLQFWQGPYFVRIQDVELAGGLKDQIAAFGRTIAAGIPFPAGLGRPEIIGLLPDRDLIPQSVCYFHTLNSLNSMVYLGNNNTLELSPHTEAVSAEYFTNPEQQSVCRVMVIRYPNKDIWKNVRDRGQTDGFGFVQEAGLIFSEYIQSYVILYFGAAELERIGGLREQIGQKVRKSSGGSDGN